MEASGHTMATMRQLLTWLSKKRFPYEPLITVNISKNRLLNNFREFQRHAPEGQVAPILKANAYGHGLYLIASTIEKEIGCPFFGVDSYFEAVALRSQGIKTPILIIAYTRPETIKKSGLKNTAFAMTTLQTLEAIADTEKETHIQIKIDTGMHRQGLYPEELKTAMEIIHKNSNIILDGVYTHFSSADENEAYTTEQISKWNKIVKETRSIFPHIKYFHASNTDGFKYSEKIEANVSRLGIGLYGITQNDFLRQKLNLQPVMEIKTILSGIKKIKAGDSVGYGNTFKAPKDMIIGTVPIGYSEGLDRRLSNRGEVLVGSEKTICPIVGRVSMNMITIDLSNVKEPKVGMAVVVMSNRKEDRNSINGMANSCDTITYEIAAKIPAHLKRILVD